MAAWTAGFQWWRSGDITRMQNVSQYMLVLALYLVVLVKLVMRKLTVNTAITVVTYICCPPVFASTKTFFSITLH